MRVMLLKSMVLRRRQAAIWLPNRVPMINCRAIMPMRPRYYGEFLSVDNTVRAELLLK